MWALHACAALDSDHLLKRLSDSDEHVRAWSIQLLAESDWPSTPALRQLERMARQDPSPVVRLYIAAAMQRTPLDRRASILELLVAHAEDATDPNLPATYWYAMEPLVAADTRAGLALMAKSKIPPLREWTTRRIAAKK
jgi:hypothetical protein